MKWLKRIVIGLVAAVAVVAAIGFLLPDNYTVERSIVVNASPTEIHEYTGDLRRWPEWGPWQEGDPTIQTTITTPTGVGAHQRWTGDSGTGELTLTASDPSKGVAYDLQFDEQWQSVAEITYAADGDKTTVVWRMAGELGMNPVSRYFGAMMDVLVGPMFERGLARLKERVATK